MKATASPKPEGFADEVTLVALVAFSIFSVSFAWLVWKPSLGWKIASIVCEPSDSSAECWALPPLSGTGAPRALPSLVNWTAPLGAGPPEVPLTVAVKVTGSPASAGLAEAFSAVAVGRTVLVRLNSAGGTAEENSA